MSPFVKQNKTSSVIALFVCFCTATVTDSPSSNSHILSVIHLPENRENTVKDDFDISDFLDRVL